MFLDPFFVFIFYFLFFYFFSIAQLMMAFLYSLSKSDELVICCLFGVENVLKLIACAFPLFLLQRGEKGPAVSTGQRVRRL